MSSERDATSRAPWWRPWAVAAAGAATVTMAVGLLLGVAAAILGVDVHWGTVVAVSALVVAVELPTMFVLAWFGRMALNLIKQSAVRNEALVQRWRDSRSEQ